MNKLEKILEILNENNQKGLVNQIEHIDEIKIQDKEEKINNLYESVMSIDFEQINSLYQLTKNKTIDEKQDISELSHLNKDSLSKEILNKYRKIGENYIKNNQYAVATMAGGQGTRLGHNGPKGTFELDVFGKKISLFELLAKQILEANIKYKVSIPWYIMTSIANNDETIDFFEKNNYFGLNKNDVIFFKQNDLPLIDHDGNLLLDTSLRVKKASDGNGGIFQSLRQSGNLADLKLRKIEYVFISGIDNCLAKLVDPVFIGATNANKMEIASKSVIKKSPDEKVGVFCRLNNHPKIIEYSEMPKKLANLYNSNQELVYSQSNIVCHLFSIRALEEVSTHTLIYHFADKKNPYLNMTFREAVPNFPNSYKFESFVFDAFELFEDMLVMQVKREEEFAPIKNKEGNDSPKTAKELFENYLNKHKKRK